MHISPRHLELSPNGVSWAYPGSRRSRGLVLSERKQSGKLALGRFLRKTCDFSGEVSNLRTELAVLIRELRRRKGLTEFVGGIRHA